uniref:Uncharacterized protein n=1 Tax=Avena sativa TaxID=4498 RepID=A0ACD5WDH0_AVESA
MAIMHHLLLVVVLLIASTLHAASSVTTNSAVDATSATAYDILEQNNLPRGLLPLGVKSYVLRQGAIEVTLPGLCDFNVTLAGQQYIIRYDPTVGGLIRPGSLTQVYGARIQLAFDFLAFDQVDRVGDQISLHGGDNKFFKNKSFPVSNFAQSHKCNK